MSVQKILIATVSGLIAGMAIGMLLAPYSGTETRHKIAESAGDLKDKLADLGRKANIKADDIRQAFTKEIEGLSNDVRQKVLRIIDAGKTVMNNNTKDVAEQARQTIDHPASQS